MPKYYRNRCALEGSSGPRARPLIEWHSLEMGDGSVYGLGKADRDTRGQSELEACRIRVFPYTCCCQSTYGYQNNKAIEDAAVTMSKLRPFLIWAGGLHTTYVHKKKKQLS